jgi:hypothetical protein
MRFHALLQALAHSQVGLSYYVLTMTSFGR